MAHLQRQRIAARRGDIRIHFPELFRDERFDLAFTLNNKTNSHRLHTPRRQAASDLFPQQRRNHVAYNAVHKATRLLSVNTVDIQFTRLFKRLTNRILCNFVEHYTAVAFVITPDHFPQVPCNGLPFAVKVGCEINVVCFFSKLFQLVNDFFFAWQHFVMCIPVVPWVNTHAVDKRATFILFRLFSPFGGGRVCALFAG